MLIGNWIGCGLQGGLEVEAEFEICDRSGSGSEGRRSKGRFVVVSVLVGKVRASIG